MGVTFNADEVLAMAQQIERNGQAFYRRASEAVSDRDVSRLLSDLSEWEKSHEQIFTRMREGLNDEEREPTAIDPYDEGQLYLSSMADEHVFVRKDLDPESLMEGMEDAEDILALAAKFERDSILFFMGLKGMVPKRLGPESVQEVIDEEVSHIAYIERRRKALRSG